MDRIIYFIVDRVAGQKTSCFLSQNDAVALRSLEFQVKGLLKEKDSITLTLMSDSDLFKVDENNGKIVKVKNIGELIPKLQEPEMVEVNGKQN